MRCPRQPRTSRVRRGRHPPRTRGAPLGRGVRAAALPCLLASGRPSHWAARVLLRVACLLLTMLASVHIVLTMSPYSNSTQIFPESPDAMVGFGRQGELREPEVEARLASYAVSDQERGQWFKAV